MNISKFIDYTLLYLLVGLSGIPFFYRSKMAIMIPAIGIAAFAYFFYKRPFHKFMGYYLVFYTLLYLGHVMKFYFLPLNTIMGLYLRIFFAYFVIAALQEKFVDYYINMLYTFVVISLIFYIPSYVPAFQNFMVTKIAPHMVSPFVDPNVGYVYPPNIIIYTFMSRGGGTVLRNSGPFWEPGAFGGFLVIALIFNFIRRGTLLDKKGKVLILGLFTTFSSTGLMAMMLFLGYFIFTHRNMYLKVLVLPLILVASGIFFSKSDLLLSKISEDMDVQNAEYNTRFKSFVLDFNDFLENPFFGLGRAEETRFKGITDHKLNHRNNGVSNYLATYGLFAFIFYFFLIYSTFKYTCKYYGMNKPYYAFFGLLLIWFIGFSEDYFNYPFFIGLTMAHIGYPLEPEVNKIV